MIANTVLKRISLAALSGSLLGLCWPGVGDLMPVIFLAFIPLLVVRDTVLESGKGRVTPYAFITFLIWNLSTTYFLFCVSEPMSTRVFSYLGPGIANALLMCIPFSLSIFVYKRSGKRLGDFALVLAWLGFEYLHMDWDLTWTWLNLGNIFAGLVPWIQWYEFTGILGGTLWIWALNLIFLKALKGYPKFERANANAATLGILVTGVPIAISLIMYWSYEPKGTLHEVVIVQPNVDPYKDKFTPGKSMEHLEEMLSMADQAMTARTELVLFPETAIQESATLGGSADALILKGLWENDIERSQSVPIIRQWLAQYPNATLLVGMSSERLLDIDETPGPSSRVIHGTERHYEAYNAAMALRKGQEAQIYHKSKLVPGVEQIPFQGLVGTLTALSLNFGGTTGSLGKQEERGVMTTVGAIKAAPVICYESIFGEYVGDYINNGANLIAIITNDGWWSDAPGYKHHLAYARLRAVETRKDIARCANTGISCFIDQKGDIHQRSGWWAKEVVKGNVRVHDELSFYTRFGDVIGRVGLLLAIILILHAFVKGRLRK